MQNNKTKVLLCSPSGGVGGISVWTSHVLNYFNTNNSEVIVKWCYSDNKHQSFANTNFVKRLFNAFVNYIPFIRLLNKEIEQDNYDVVHFTTSASISLLRDIITLRMCKKKHIKTIIHFRFGRIPELFKKRNWEKQLLHKVIKLSDCVIVIDNASYDTLCGAGYDNVCLLPNPLGPNVSKIIAANTNIKREKRKIVFVGHVVPTKGVVELINACTNIPNILLTIIGSYSDDIKSLLSNIAGNDREKWLCLKGNIPHDEVIREMLSSNLFVLPTYTEGFPNVVIEAMACGCTIITTPVGAIPEMLDIDGKEPAGVCVSVGNIEKLKEKIEYYLDNDNEALILGDRAKIRVNKMYSMDSVISQLVNIWNNII